MYRDKLSLVLSTISLLCLCSNVFAKQFINEDYMALSLVGVWCDGFSFWEFEATPANKYPTYRRYSIELDQKVLQESGKYVLMSEELSLLNQEGYEIEKGILVYWNKDACTWRKINDNGNDNAAYLFFVCNLREWASIDMKLVSLLISEKNDLKLLNQRLNDPEGFPVDLLRPNEFSQKAQVIMTRFWAACYNMLNYFEAEEYFDAFLIEIEIAKE